MSVCRTLLLASALFGYASAARLRNASSITVLKAGANASSALKAGAKKTPCECHPNDPSWKQTTRTVPKCIFLDLGAADGNTFNDFLNGKYGPVENCPSGKWEAWLVEANPKFDAPLKAEEAKYPGEVHALNSHAAYSCVGQTSFFIDTDPTHNHWGSSMSSEAPDAVKSGKQEVTVPTINVMQLIAENTLPTDWVMLKVDIEGAEYDVVPCLAQYTNANLVKRMYLEEHTWFKTGSVNGQPQMDAAKAKLKAMHVDIPGYFSNTL